MTISNSFKRFAAAALALIVVAGAAPANLGGGVKLFDTAVVASAEGLADTSETAKQKDESDYVGFNTNGISLNLYGKDGETTIRTTYGNTGFKFYIAVSDDGVNYTNAYNIYSDYSLTLGKVYDFSTELGVKVKISAELVNGGKTVKIDYDVENTSETKKYIKIGSMGDTQLTTPKRLEANSRDGDNVAVTKTASGITLSNEDLKFDIALSDVNDLGVWIGFFFNCFDNYFGNGVEDVKDDSGVTWHWAYELDAGKTRNTSVFSGAMIAAYTVDFDTNGGSTVPTQGVNEGDKANKPDDPTKEGYKFEGWYADKELTTPFDFDSAISGNTTVYAKWTKDQIKPTYAPVLAEGLTYNGDAQNLVTSDNGEGGAIHYVYRKTGDTAWTAAASGYPQVKDAGIYEVGWYSEESDDYLAAGSALVPNIAGTVTIAKADAAVKTAPEAVSGLIANGKHQELVTAGEAEGGKLVYAVTTDKDKAPADDEYSETIPTATNEGAYYVWYKVKGDENHSDSEPACVEVSIVDNRIDISESTVTVDTENKTVTVKADGKTVPASEYHIIYFTYEKTAGGETLTRVGTDFPTEPGTYIAGIVANEDSTLYIGENRSEPFTITAPEPAKDTEPSDTPPKTGTAAAGISLATVVTAAAIIIKRKK